MSANKWYGPDARANGKKMGGTNGQGGRWEYTPDGHMVWVQDTPTFTPGINFGAGVLPGQNPNGTPYQRQWFELGNDPTQESLNHTFYDDPSNFGLAWQKVLNEFGGMPGSDFYEFLQGFSGTAQKEFNNLAPYGGDDIHVADFIDAYAPQLKGVYDLIPGARKNQRLGLGGRANY